MAELAPGDISVTGGPDADSVPGDPVRYTIAFGQHFAGRDVQLSVDADGLTDEPVDAWPELVSTGADDEPSTDAGGAGTGEEVELESELAGGEVPDPEVTARSEREKLDAEVEAEVEKINRPAQRPVPAVRRMMEKSGDLESLRGGLREKKTLDFLIQHARVSAS